MTPSELIAAFETLADARDGVKRLRELVLQLAMRGKLVPQAPEDESVQVSSTSSETDLPYLLPHAWKWVKLVDIATYNGRPKVEADDIDPDCWVLDLEDIEKSTSRLLARVPYQARKSTSTKSSFQPGDVLYGKLRPYLDKVLIADCPGVCTTEIVPIVPHSVVSSEWLRWSLKRPDFLNYVSRISYGVKMPRLGTDDAVSSIHPLPPLAEQLRIVARVDELMGLLDRLQAARTARDEIRRTAREAALAALRDAEDTDAAEAAWARVSDHMDAFFTDPEDVTPLRQTILQLAVRGRLVPQDSTDEPASRLAEKLAREKPGLHRAGLAPAPKALDPITTSPYPLPPNWTWVRADLVCSHVVDCLHRTPVYLETGFPAIRTCDVEPGRVLIDRALRVDEATFREQTQRLTPREGDVLYSREGGRYGIAAVIPPGTVLCLSQRMMQFRCMPSIDPEYFAWFLNSPLGFGQASADVGGSASPHVNISSIRQFFFPLPPEGEQKRISAQIKSMMTLCDQLEDQLTAARERQAQFAAAALHHLDM